MPLSFDHPSPEDDRDFGRQLAAHDAIAHLRAENDRLRAALESAIQDVELMACVLESRAKVENETANLAQARELRSHAAIYRAALTGKEG